MQTPRRKGLAVTDRGSHVRLWLTAGVGVALDLATKSLAWRALGGPPEDGGHEVSIIPGWLRLVASRNPGIVFGLDFSQDAGLNPAAARVLTVLLTLVTSALIFYVFASSSPGRKWTHFGCGLILAGALGNLFDRVVFGYVRDLIQITGEINLSGRTLSWPFVFNVADVYLVAGVVAVAAIVIFAPSGGAAGDRGAESRKEV